MGTLDGITAANRDVGNAPPGPSQDCRDVVHVMLFFDGTGCNRFDADATKSWSNVARLFFAARDEPKNNTYPIYISGVGTKYNLPSRYWGESLDAWAEDNTLGGAAGTGGDRRLDGGSSQANDALEKALLNSARNEGGKVQKIAEKMEGEGFQKMVASLGKHRLIKTINFSVFGFSRGAALARAFSNRLANDLKVGGSAGYQYHGVDARINFLGIFDTVASFGLPGKNWGGWTPKALEISSKVEMCHHYVAAHELRYSFPVDLIRDQNGYGTNMLERVYPGVHTDVGGGYEPGKQGRKDTVARIPLLHMLGEAITYGTRLHSFDFLKENRPGLAERLAVDKETTAAYKKYMAACGAKGGSVEKQVERHMQLYYAYRGTQHRAKVGSSSTNERRLTELRKQLATTEAAENKAETDKWHEIGFGTLASAKSAQKKEEQLEAQRDNLKAELKAAEADAARLAESDNDIAVQAYALRRAIEKKQNLVLKDGKMVLVLEKPKWMLDAWNSPAAPDVCSFFDNYVHDSRTDFARGYEPFVYFRTRDKHEQSTE